MVSAGAAVATRASSVSVVTLHSCIDNIFIANNDVMIYLVCILRTNTACNYSHLTRFNSYLGLVCPIDRVRCTAYQLHHITFLDSFVRAPVEFDLLAANLHFKFSQTVALATVLPFSEEAHHVRQVVQSESDSTGRSCPAWCFLVRRHLGSPPFCNEAGI